MTRCLTSAQQTSLNVCPLSWSFRVFRARAVSNILSKQRFPDPLDNLQGGRQNSLKANKKRKS